jgi:glycosyltransferase involved in cell wall biosynthesis
MISVIVCTRDRAPKLKRCLRHMAETYRRAELRWQLIVVDNGSVDDTKAVVAEFADALPLSYAYEAKHGLSHARNRGIAMAEHDIIAFTDDDCLVAPDWARTIVGEFAAKPELSILGGRVELADAGDHRVALRVHDRAEAVTTIERIMVMMSGCNIAFRRDVFDEVGRFDTAFGKGKRIGSAEDIELLYRALKRGRTIGYSPNVLVRHAHGRNTPAALESLAHDYIKGRGAFYCKFIGDRQIAKMAYWEVRSLLKAWRRFPLRSESPRALCSLAAGAFYKCANGTLDGAAHAVHRLAH